MRTMIKAGVPALLAAAVLSACAGPATPAAPSPSATRSSAALTPAATPTSDPKRDAHVTAAGPTSDPKRDAHVTPAGPTSDPKREVYVAVGASETVGLGADDPAQQAWPTVLHGTSLADWEYLNLGVSGSTVAQAISEQLPRALAAEPRLVTVWLNVNDITHLVPPNVYEQLLGSLVHQLRRDGQTEVVVANTPAVEQLPAYRGCLPSAPDNGRACDLPGVPAPSVVRQVVGEYNAAIDRVAKAEGAAVVDLNAASGRRSLATMTGDDGFHPSTKGHRAVARAFAAAVDQVEGQDR